MLREGRGHDLPSVSADYYDPYLFLSQNILSSDLRSLLKRL